MSVCVTLRLCVLLCCSNAMHAARTRLLLSRLIMSSMVHRHHLQRGLSLDGGAAENEGGGRDRGDEGRKETQRGVERETRI